MPFDGNGNFELLYDFEADRDAGFPSNRILAEKMMDMFQDVAAGLEDTSSEAYARLTGTSTTSTAIGTGTKTFTTQANKAFSVGRWLLIASDANPANYMHGRVTAYSGTSLEVNVTNIGGSGTLADWTISVSGTQGGHGGSVSVPFTYSTTTTDSDPGSGIVRLNHATPASATAAYIDNNNSGAVDVSAWLDTIDDAGTSLLRGLLFISDQSSPGANFRIFSVSGSVVDGTGYRKLTIAHIAGGGSFANGSAIDVSFVPNGLTGETGSTGATGAQGAMAAVPYNYSTTTTDSDPGSGNIRFNHATLSSATAAYIDNENRSAADVSAWLDTFDDNGNSSLRGTLYVYVPATPGVNFRIYSVTGSVVDGTGYRKLTLSHVAGGGSFTNGAEIDLLFVPRGPPGSGLADLVDDTTPQLGSDLDANGHSIGFDNATGIIDDSGNEQLVFQKTASAVAQWEMTNAATGNAPMLQAVGETNTEGTIGASGTGGIRFPSQPYCPQATLTDQATIAWNLTTQPSAIVTLANNRTLDAPTNQKAGSTYVLVIKQDGTGGRTLAWNAAYKFPGGIDPTLSTGANDVDVVSFVSDGTNMYGVAACDFS